MEDGCSNRKGACGRWCLSRYSLGLRRRNDAAQLPCPGQARRACEAIRTIHGRRARQRSALHGSLSPPAGNVLFLETSRLRLCCSCALNTAVP
jgi:hypothetical protein